MGMLGSSISLTRFAVQGLLPVASKEEFWPLVAERLQRFAFKPIDQTLDERSIGFVELRDHKEFGFSNPGETWIGDWLVFSLRQDTRRVPGAVLKDELAKAHKEWLEGHPGVRRVPKQVREQILDSVKLRLLAKTLPVPAVVDVAWDIARNRLLLFTTNAKTIDEFTGLFKKAFHECVPMLVSPFALACSLMPDHFVETAKGLNKATSESVLDQIRSNAWLGQELLYYILVRSQNEGDTGAYIDGKINLEGPTADGVQRINVTCLSDRLQTVKAALREGKTITTARLALAALKEPDIEHLMTLKADTFAINSFKTPPVMIERGATEDEASEFQAVVLEKLYLIGQGLEALEHHLSQYIVNKLTDRWQHITAAGNEWLEE